MWATIPRAAEPTVSAGAADETSVRAASASRTAVGISSRSTQLACREPLAFPRRRRPLDLGDRRVQVGRVERVGAAELAAAVAHPLVEEVEAEPLGGLLDSGVLLEDELGAHLDDGAVVELARPHAPADAVARLQHDDLGPTAAQLIRGGEPGEPGAYDDDAHGVYSRLIITCLISV